ncbi:MAG TPA: hypothetical protein VFQ91_21190 [Bryobacteraceae bacterium]|nr:hypothetical protein [Bryobacteraceae bacterium]
MPRATLARLQVANPDILRFFCQSKKRVYHFQELARTLRERREEWDTGPRMTTEALISLLTASGELRRVIIEPGKRHPRGTSFTRYVWGAASPEEIALSLRKGSYLSHGSAAAAHGLCGDAPRRVIYVNQEQSPKEPGDGGTITQDGIDRAFRGKQRQSTFIYECEGVEIVVLNGKHTAALEVSADPAVTRLERTLIDIAVRPSYAGGVDEVLAAYRAAAGKAMAARLLSTLRKLNYLYPYHQAVGFYMERAGFPSAQSLRMKEPGIKWDFYLAHNIKDRAYCSGWRIYYPKSWQPL